MTQEILGGKTYIKKHYNVNEHYQDNGRRNH